MKIFTLIVPLILVTAPAHGMLSLASKTSQISTATALIALHTTTTQLQEKKADLNNQINTIKSDRIENIALTPLYAGLTCAGATAGFWAITTPPLDTLTFINTFIGFGGSAASGMFTAYLLKEILKQSRQIKEFENQLISIEAQEKTINTGAQNNN